MTKENLFERFKKYKINIENVNFKSNIMNIENTYINGEEYLGKDENNIPIGMNKKLEKVKSK